MRRNKYGAIRTKVDGITFHSKKEAARYLELKMLQKGKKIEFLKLQPKFPIDFNGVKICTYIADFSYRDRDTGAIIYEDVKSPATAKLPMYRLKKKLVKARYGIDIKET